MDKLANEPVLATGTLADLDRPERFSELLAKAEKAKQINQSSDL